jgi:hypothetical protein
VARYKDYARDLKVKFEAYEVESEKYYADMLDKFKAQAKDVCLKKEQEYESFKKLKESKES